MKVIRGRSISSPKGPLSLRRRTPISLVPRRVMTTLGFLTRPLSIEKFRRMRYMAPILTCNVAGGRPGGQCVVT